MKNCRNMYSKMAKYFQVETKKVLSILMSISLIVLFYVGATLMYGNSNTVKALNTVTLNVANGRIDFHPTYYTQGGTTFDCDSSITQYVITGSVSNANNVLIAHDDNGGSVTYNIIFYNLSISPASWSSTVEFGGRNRGTSATININLHLKGTNSISGDNHAGIWGDATVNISAEGGSRSTFSASYSTVSAVYSAIVLNKVGEFTATVNGKVTNNLDDAKSGKPLVITKEYINPTCNPPTGLAGVYGETLSSVTLANPSGNTPGTWTWDNPSTVLTVMGSQAYTATFTPTDTSTYNTMSNISVTVMIVGTIEKPGGYLKGMVDNVGDVDEDWYVPPDMDFYDKIISDYYAGYSTEADALEIRTKEELAAFGKAVNDGGKTFEGKYVKVMNDIDLQGNGITFTNSSSSDFTVTIDKVGTPSNLWHPIGTYGTAFKGTINGQNYDISNLLSYDAETSDRSYAGLFGKTDSATIKNVCVTGNSVAYSFSAENNTNGGGLVGCAYGGTIQNCNSNCTVYSNGSADVAVWAGGLVGDCDANIYDSCATGNAYIIGRKLCAGGMFGENSHEDIVVSKCYSTGNVYTCELSGSAVTGGFAGSVSVYPNKTLSTVIKNCYSTGHVYAYTPPATTSARNMTGGFVGYYGYVTTNSLIKNCYSTGDSYCYEDTNNHSGDPSNLGGFAGQCSVQASLANCFSAGNIFGHSSSSTFQKFCNLYNTNSFENCYYSSSAIAKQDSQNVSGTFNGTATVLSNLKGTVTNTISGFNDDHVWIFEDGEFPKFMLGDLYLMDVNTDNVTVINSNYIQPDNSFYNQIISDYDDGYNSMETALEISTKEQFAAFGKAVNDGGKTFEQKYIKLVNDIDFQGSGVDYISESLGANKFRIIVSGTPINMWWAIGNNTTQFKGTFDGQNHSICNMVAVNKTITDSKYMYSGLFGYTIGATIKNLELSGNSSAVCIGKGATLGGIVAWFVEGTIINCHSNCNTYGRSTTSLWSGGLVGDCDGSIYDSYATGNTYGYGVEVARLGGLFGETNSSSITSNIDCCYSTGNAYAGSDKEPYAGGLVGFISTSKATIKNCYAIGNASSFVPDSATSAKYSMSGGFSGYLAYGTVLRCYAMGNSFVNHESSVYASSTNTSSGAFSGHISTQGSCIDCFGVGSNYTFGNGVNSYGGFSRNPYEATTVSNCYFNSSAEHKVNGANSSIHSSYTATNVSNLKGMVTNTISGFNDDNAWYFADDKYPKLMWQLSANVNLGDAQVNSDGSTYYMFPSAVVTSETSDLKIYSIIVSAMDSENSEELKAGVRIVSTGNKMTADSNNIDNSQYYTSTNGISLLQAQTFIRDLKFYCSEDFSAKVQLSYVQLPSDVHYYPGTGHYYQVVNESKTWIEAYKAALNSNFRGTQGYLANITSEGESNFINNFVSLSAWIGGTRFVVDNINTTLASYTDTNIGYWYWASGPELLYNPNTKSYGEPNSTNSIFYNKVKSTDTTTNGTIIYDYNNWNEQQGQPDNAYNDGYLNIWGNNENNTWNDYYSTIALDYFSVEYGDRLYGNSEAISCMVSTLKEVSTEINVSIITESGRHLNEISSETVYDDECTINTNSDGVETVKIVSSSYPGGAIMHSLETMDGYFVRNQKFILADCSTPAQYYYYVVQSDNLTQIPLTSFKLMQDKTTPWSEPESGSCTDTLQFVIDFSDTNQSVEKQVQHLKLSYKVNSNDVGSGSITINFGDNGFYSEASGDDENVVLKARGNGNKNVYAVAKITDLNGNQMNFNSNQVLSSNRGTFEIVRGGFAKLDLGQVSSNLRTYSLSNVTLTGMPKMMYNILICVCVGKSSESDYPCVQSSSFATINMS